MIPPMNRTTVARMFAGGRFLLGWWVAFTQTSQPPQLTTNKVKEDLYEIEGDGGNVAVLVTTEGVILVDDKYDQDHDAIVAQVKTVTPQPVKYVLSTHHHADHSGGNAKLLPTAQIISTANALQHSVQHKHGNAPPGMAGGRGGVTAEGVGGLGGKETGARE